MKILMVCLGNICRSPIAEGVLLEKIKKHNLDWEVDSAGIGHWHTGEKPDERAIFTANKFGIDITYQRARQFSKPDFRKFDKIYAMDLPVKKFLLSLADNETESEKVDLILNELHPGKNLSIRDPYEDNDLKGFEETFLVLEKPVKRLFKNILRGRNNQWA